MKKGLIVSGMMVLAIGSFVSNGKADCGIVGKVTDLTTYNATTDPVRMISGFVASIIGLFGDGEAKAELIATQEENDKNTSGSSGSAASTDTSSGSFTNTLGSAGGSEFSGSAFDYVNTVLFAKEGNVGYAPLKNALASASDAQTVRQNIRKKVLEEFFADPTKAEQTTTEYQEKIRNQRNNYVQEAARRHVTFGYRVKGYIQNDLSAIATIPLAGDGELGAIAVDAHTLEQMVKMELVDLALQIEMMEADAIQFMMHQPLELMSETKTTRKGK